MMISGWNKRYSEILHEFKYSEKQDTASAIILDSILRKTIPIKKISEQIKGKTVFVIGAGPSLSFAIPVFKNFKKKVKNVGDSGGKPLVEKGIKKNNIFVIHANGDNIKKLYLVENFKNWIGTTQSKPFKNIQNFGGFTDGDRAVFLASYFDAKKIILFGMDFGEKIGKYSQTKAAERKTKLKKLRKGKSLLEWLSGKTRSQLFTTSSPIRGFEKIRYSELDIII